MTERSQLQMSVFTLYSIGTAAENLEFGQRQLEVWPAEQKQAIDGDITSNQENISTEGEDGSGQKFTQNINTGNVIRAEWLSRNTCRPYPSLVRRGDPVMIWRNADSDEFWWEEMGTEIYHRRGDIFTLACISTIVNEGDPISMQNAYWFEIDSLNGVIRLATTQLNEEACTYLFEIMTKEGVFRLQDSIGNYLRLDSTDSRWRMMNASDTLLDMEAENTTLSMQGKFTVNAANMELNIQELFKLTTNEIDITANNKTEKIQAQYSLTAMTATMTANTSYSINSPSIGLNGAITGGGFGGGAGNATFNGPMTITEKATVQGGADVTGDLTNNGINVTTHDHPDAHGGNTGPMQ